MAQSPIEQAQETGLDSPKRGTRIRNVSLALIVLIIAAAVGVTYYYVGTKQAERQGAIEKDLHNIAVSRAVEVNNWLKSSQEPALRFANAAAVRDFASKTVADGDNPVVMIEPGSDGERDTDFALLQSYLRDIARDYEFSYGGITNRSGEMYLFTDSSRRTLNTTARSIVRDVAQSGETRFGPAFADPQYGLLASIFLPIVLKDAEGKDFVASVLYLTKPVGPKLRDLFTLTGFAYTGKGYNITIVQKFGPEMQMILYSQDRVQDIAELTPDKERNIPFGLRNGIRTGTQVYSKGIKLLLTDWWVLLEQDYAEAVRAQQNTDKNIYMLAGLITLVLVLLVAAGGWWLIGHERSLVLNQFRNLFKVIDEQKRLLDSINSTIDDPISLTDAKGTYLYVNRAFALAIGRDAKDVPGLDTSAVFGFDTAKRLNVTDQHVLMTSESVTVNEVIWLQSKRHYYQISKSPLKDADNQSPQGIVAVYRDMTKVVETEERSRRVVQQTIAALVRAIEQSDPFLGGHSRIMGEVAKLIARSMNLSERDSATIVTAATLSQIGKLFVPREVLTKPGALTDEEKKVMEQHVDHTANILNGIEFDLPVIDAISQMNERLDGQGYPRGLEGDEIKIYGRILAIANAFTAMARPRSYRPAMPVDKVLSILEQESGSYDHNIVEVLRHTLGTPAGEQVVAMAASSKSV